MPDDGGGGGGGGGPFPPITFGGGGGGGGGIESGDDVLPGVDAGKPPFPPLLLNGPAAGKPPFFPGLGPLLLPNISADLAPTILTLVPERIPWKIKGGYWLKIFLK